MDRTGLPEDNHIRYCISYASYFYQLVRAHGYMPQSLFTLFSKVA